MKGPTPVVMIIDDPIIMAAVIMPVVKRFEELSKALIRCSSFSKMKDEAQLPALDLFYYLQQLARQFTLHGQEI